MEEPRPQNGGSYLVAVARCVDCRSDVHAYYELNTKRSERGFDTNSFDPEIRSGGQEIRVTFKNAHETRHAYYELTSLDNTS